MNKGNVRKDVKKGVKPTMHRIFTIILLHLLIGLLTLPMLFVFMTLLRISGVAIEQIEATSPMSMITVFISALIVTFVICVIFLNTTGRHLEAKAVILPSHREMSIAGAIIAVLAIGLGLSAWEVSSWETLPEVIAQLPSSQTAEQLMRSNWVLQAVWIGVLVVVYPIVDTIFYRVLIQQYITRISSHTAGILVTALFYGAVSLSPFLALASIPFGILYAQRNNAFVSILVSIITGAMAIAFVYYTLSTV